MRRRIQIGYLIDTWMWIEYWRGNAATREYIECDDPIYTSIITLTEVTRYCIRELDIKSISPRLADIRARSKILNIDEATAEQAGRYINQAVPGLADAIILATARKNDLKIVTGDHHFKLLPDAIVIEPAE
jgi:predicted nucleic acid-binding protein